MTIEQFIENTATQIGILAANQFKQASAPLAKEIIQLQAQLKATQEKLPHKERVKITKKGK